MSQSLCERLRQRAHEDLEFAGSDSPVDKYQRFEQYKVYVSRRPGTHYLLFNQPETFITS